MRSAVVDYDMHFARYDVLSLFYLPQKFLIFLQMLHVSQGSWDRSLTCIEYFCGVQAIARSFRKNNLGAMGDSTWDQ
eukprot:12582114-Alexandrium_andersonii.AAC.1